MNSLPFISHHLFVAAVNERDPAARSPDHTEALAPARRESREGDTHWNWSISAQTVAGRSAVPADGHS